MFQAEHSEPKIRITHYIAMYVHNHMHSYTYIALQT